MKREEKKPQISIRTMGHLDHGKVTLTEQITKELKMQKQGLEPIFDEIHTQPTLAEPFIKVIAKKSKTNEENTEQDLNIDL